MVGKKKKVEDILNECDKETFGKIKWKLRLQSVHLLSRDSFVQNLTVRHLKFLL